MSLLARLRSPVLLAGDERTAYRDPAALWEDGVMHLYYTLVENPPGKAPLMTVAESLSTDLCHWSPPRRLTPYDRACNYSSPGNIIRISDGYAMCLQTYCRENGEKYGNERSRLFLMRSPDLENWSEPELMRVKGDDVPAEQIGRMIDPYLIHHGTEWWCFYKQNGICFSSSPDLCHWRFRGGVQAGENPCILPVADGYLMFHSPENGIAVKRSEDLLRWSEWGGHIILDQPRWAWARGRLTAAFVLDMRSVAQFGCYLMFFHGSGPEDEETMFDIHASIGLAWSQDLAHWHWPGE